MNMNIGCTLNRQKTLCNTLFALSKMNNLHQYVHKIELPNYSFQQVSAFFQAQSLPINIFLTSSSILFLTPNRPWLSSRGRILYTSHSRLPIICLPISACHNGVADQIRNLRLSRIGLKLRRKVGFSFPSSLRHPFFRPITGMHDSQKIEMA